MKPEYQHSDITSCINSSRLETKDSVTDADFKMVNNINSNANAQLNKDRILTGNIDKIIYSDPF